MQIKKLIKYFSSEVLNLNYVISSFLLEIIFFLILNKLSFDDYILYLKYFTILNVGYYFINLIARRISKQSLFFINERRKLLISFLIIHLGIVIIQSIIYYSLFTFLCLLKGVRLDLLRFFDYFFYYLIIFLVFLNCYKLSSDNRILLIIPLILVSILFTNILTDYNYLFLKLEYSNTIYLNNSPLEIIMFLFFHLVSYILLSLFKKEK